MKYFIDTNIIIDFLDNNEEAIQFSRYCHSKGVKLKGKCEAIDFLHFITAKYYDLILISNDRDLDRLECSYGEFQAMEVGES
jgi:predicted nucleic acid-binding protein